MACEQKGILFGLNHRERSAANIVQNAAGVGRVLVERATDGHPFRDQGSGQAMRHMARMAGWLMDFPR